MSLRAALERYLWRQWLASNALTTVLSPVERLYRWHVERRAARYGSGRLRPERVGVPVVVIGNITVGGTGKTPLVIHVTRMLAARGRRPGVIGRGYGGRSRIWPLAVSVDTEPCLAGDEAVVIANRTGSPVVVGPDRIMAGRMLVESFGCDVVVSDDGLQHLRLARDVEIAVIDGARRLGNGRCLPAGPLRESADRLAAVDMCVVNGEAWNPTAWSMRMQVGRLRGVASDDEGPSLEEMCGARVHAVAGIGNPDRFFESLRAAGLEVVEHRFADHHHYGGGELGHLDDAPVVMTEKDAVKCRTLARPGFWYLPVEAVLPSSFDERLLSLLPG